MYVLIRPAACPDHRAPSSIACAALPRAAAILHQVSGAPFEPNPIRHIMAISWSEPEGEGGAATKQFLSSSAARGNMRLKNRK